MERRIFLRNTLLATAAAGVAERLPAQTKPTGPVVVQVSGESPYEITKRAIAELGGMNRFITRQDVVMVKPNIGWNRNVEQAACTNPEVVRAVVELVLAAGAKKVIVMDNTCHQAKDTYIQSGIAEAARKAGAEIRYTDENRLITRNFKGESVKDWPVFKDFIEVDKFINVPVLKHHGSAGITIGMKNLYGILGGNRGKLHRDMGIGIADLTAGFKCHLTVVDAYRILRRNGPVGGRLSDVEVKKTVFASPQIVEVDAVAAAFFGAVPQEVEYLQVAGERNLGRIDPKVINPRVLTI
jgi:uncharacterized protein (DUF362 family)